MIAYQNRFIRIFFLFIAVAVVQLVPNTLRAADMMPAFSLTSAIDGKQVKSDDFKGKALLVTFFATWCPPCRQEIPSLIKLQDEFSSQGFSVIGFSMDEKGPKVVAKLVEKEKINYPVLMSESKTEREFGGIVGIPTSFLINRQGKIIKRYPGYVQHDQLAEDIKAIL